MKYQKGQVLLLVILVITGTLLSATTIAGLLMTNQIRQSTDVSQSARAIMAADAGLEWELYRFYKDPTQPAPIMSNGTSFVTSTSTAAIRSIGTSGTVSRALQLSF